jgi:hypothetical protein
MIDDNNANWSVLGSIFISVKESDLEENGHVCIQSFQREAIIQADHDFIKATRDYFNVVLGQPVKQITNISGRHNY